MYVTLFEEITSGASNDIEKATALAQRYVCEYGMSKLGTRKYGKTHALKLLNKSSFALLQNKINGNFYADFL